MRSRAAGVLAACLVLSALAGCDSADPRTTAQVEAISGGRLCLVPEDPKQTSLRDCYPVEARGAPEVEVGDCVDVRIPHDAPKRGLYDLEVLHRDCHVGRAATTGFGDTIGLVGFLVALGGLGFFAAWATQRRRARRSLPPSAASD